MLGFDFQKISAFHRFSDDFQDFGTIGTGGFANVHKVKNKIDGNLYALKIVKIKPSQLKEGLDDYFYRMLSEAKTHSTLSHPNILQFNGCWLELLDYEHDEKTHTSTSKIQDDSDIEMVILNESFNSEEIAFGSSSSQSIVQNTNDHFSISISSVNIDENLKKVQLNHQSLAYYKEIQIYILAELCQENLQHYIYQRNVDNKSKQMEQREKQIEIVKNCKMILQIINGLRYLHSKNIIHRDIKLQNIVIDAENVCKIIDFGLAKKVKLWKSAIQDSRYSCRVDSYSLSIEDIDERHSGSVGTRLFSSPEQASSDKYDHRTDIYSLGIVMALIFSNFTTAHEQREILQSIRNKKIDSINIPEKVKLNILKCLSREEQRPNLAEIRRCVKNLLNETMGKLDIRENQKQRKSNLNQTERIPFQQIKVGSNYRSKKCYE